jgi:hypothetical protein
LLLVEDKVEVATVVAVAQVDFVTLHLNHSQQQVTLAQLVRAVLVALLTLMVVAEATRNLVH